MLLPPITIQRHRVVEPALLIVVRQTQHLHVAQVVPFNVDADAVLRGFQQNPRLTLGIWDILNGKPW